MNVNFMASNGLEAYNEFVRAGIEFYDLIFMDLDMPVLDGKMSSAKIRAYEALSNCKNRTKIVILTGNCTEEELNLCLDKKGQVQADYFYRKPMPLSDC